MNADGSNQTRLTNDTGLDEFPTFNAFGTQITFDSNPMATSTSTR